MEPSVSGLLPATGNRADAFAATPKHQMPYGKKQARVLNPGPSACAHAKPLKLLPGHSVMQADKPCGKRH